MGVGNATAGILSTARNVTDEVLSRAPRGKLIRIEAYVCVTLGVIAFLIIFGSYRRRCNSKFLRALVWVAYNLTTILVPYTMGQMQSAPFHDELFAIWAVFMLLFFGSADSISAYDLNDNEQWKRYGSQFLIQYCLVWWIIDSYSYEKSFKVSIQLLIGFTFLKPHERFLANAYASRFGSRGLVRSTKPIADFMAYEHEFSQGEIDPACMKGYNYLVEGLKIKDLVKFPSPHYQARLDIKNQEVITIEKIWQCNGGLLSSRGDPDGRLKDICLSFALFQLLLRRCAGHPLLECTHEKTWNFVRYGLLRGEDGYDSYERAFRVIEVELAFVFDFFYTKYPAIFGKRFLLYRTVHVIIFGIGCWVAIYTLVHYKKPEGDLNLVTDGRNIDVLITGLVIIAVLSFEIVQFYLILVSDWAKVWCLVKYVQKPCLQGNRLIERAIKTICRRKMLNYWEKKIGQYSFLESFYKNPSRWLRNILPTRTHIKLPVAVKRAVIRTLKTNGRRLTNGEASLRRHGVESELSWACRLETQIHVIMVWHIATSLCEIASQQSRPKENSFVATSLSKYCAYLVVNAPRLLPDHSFGTEIMFREIVREARILLKGCETMDSRYKKMMALGENHHEETIIERGAVLGKRLIEGIEDAEKRWKVLADFWAELMLFVAPSDDAMAHAEYLARGGEFVTHLWALLSHAGILARDSVVHGA